MDNSGEISVMESDNIAELEETQEALEKTRMKKRKMGRRKKLNTMLMMLKVIIFH